MPRGRPMTPSGICSTLKATVYDTTAPTATEPAIRDIAARDDVDVVEADLVIELIEPVASEKVADKDAAGIGITPATALAEAAGLEIDNGIKTDAGLRTTNRKVYAIGDVAGGMQFTHVAGYHAGLIIREALFGLPAKAKTAHIPWATYTSPELAQVGPTEAEARRIHGDKLEVARFDYHHNDRAIAERKTTGFIKVMVVKGRPVGATIVGAQAGELIGLWALAVGDELAVHLPVRRAGQR